MPARYYAVYGTGGRVFHTDAAARAYMKRHRGTRYKSFASRPRADEFARTGTVVERVPSDDTARVYTDGSYLAKEARAGYGVHFVGRDDLAVAAPLVGATSSDVAELAALRAAFTTIAANSARFPTNITLVTDSTYAHGCAVGAQRLWERARFWTTHPANQPLLRTVFAAYDAAAAAGHRFRFEWTRAHSGDPSNERADALAKAGARKVR